MAADQTQWMPQPQVPVGCPPGLEYLAQIDQLLIHQKVELLEAFTGFETQNKYEIKNSLGQRVFYAAEKSDCCDRYCCGPLRPYEMSIVDNNGQEVIHIHRPLNCQGCCCPCCLQTLEVTAPPGQVVGTVDEEWSFCDPKFLVKDAAGNVVFKVRGQCCNFCTKCCSDIDFLVLSADESTEVGKITKQWSGLGREMFTDATHFSVSFPLDLDVRMKATMLGACFMVDYIYFEKSQN